MFIAYKYIMVIKKEKYDLWGKKHQYLFIHTSLCFALMKFDVACYKSTLWYNNLFKDRILWFQSYSKEKEKDTDFYIFFFFFL